MDKIPMPTALTLDPNDENIILEMPDDRDPNDEQNESSDAAKKKVTHSTRICFRFFYWYVLSNIAIMA